MDLAGPKAGEVLVRIVATGVCHTDAFTLSGADPEGLFPAILGHEGGGIVEESVAAYASVKPGDHVIPLYTPECGECEDCLSGKTNLCTRIRAHPEQGGHARRHLALLVQGQADLALHGHEHLLRTHGVAGDLGREDQSQGAARQGVSARLRHHRGHRRGVQHRAR